MNGREGYSILGWKLFFFRILQVLFPLFSLKPEILLIPDSLYVFSLRKLVESSFSPHYPKISHDMP